MEQNWIKIKSLFDSESGYLRTSQVERAGMCRPLLKKYVDAGLITRIRKGIYVATAGMPDEYALIQAQGTKAIFSYGTALFLWGMSDRVPHIIDITLPHGTNTTILRRNNDNLRCHYVMSDVYEIGITDTKSPQGGIVRLYDRERCICDLIRSKGVVDMQLYIQAIKEYFGKTANVRKLLKYGKVFGIEEKIRNYMEVLV